MVGTRALVVFYSWTGPTQQVATRIACLASGHVEQLVDRRNQGGIGGYLRAGLGAKLRFDADLAPTRFDPAEYDVVIVGTPIASGSIAPPVRAYLLAHRGRLRRVAFFSTHGGGGSQEGLREMEALAGVPPLVSLVLRKSDIDCGNYELKLRSFVGEIERRVAGDLRSVFPPSLPPPVSSSSLPPSQSVSSPLLVPPSSQRSILKSA
jgi:menaquinone-dependent protoporphyrinogen IX oxidase